MFCSVPNTPGPLQTLIENDSVEYNTINTVFNVMNLTKKRVTDIIMVVQ